MHGDASPVMVTPPGPSPRPYLASELRLAPRGCAAGSACRCGSAAPSTKSSGSGATSWSDRGAERLAEKHAAPHTGAARATGRYSRRGVKGASAGGLNGRMITTRRRDGQRPGRLRHAPRRVAGCRVRDRGPAQPRARARRTTRSSAATLLEELRKNLAELIDATPEDQAPVVDRLDVFLSVTSVVSVQLAQRHRRSHCAGHRTDGSTARSTSASATPCSTSHAPHTPEKYCFAQHARPQPSRWPSSRCASRPTSWSATSTFRPARPDPPPALRRWRHRRHAGRKAARAIADAPADGPTDRLLPVLHPDPGGARHVGGEAGARIPRRPRDLRCPPVRRAPARPCDHSAPTSLVDDLQAIEAHDETVERQHTDRDRLLQPLRPSAARISDVDAVLAPELNATAARRTVSRHPRDQSRSSPSRRLRRRRVGATARRSTGSSRRLRAGAGHDDAPARGDELPALSRSSLRP